MVSGRGSLIIAAMFFLTLITASVWAQEIEEEPSVYQNAWQNFQSGIKDALTPHYHVQKNFAGLHYKNFVLGNTLTFKDGDFSTPLADINSNYNAWGAFYVNYHDALRTHFSASFYEYVKLDHAYTPTQGSRAAVSQIKLTEGDFSLAYVVYPSSQVPLYAGAGLTAGHLKIQNTVRSREKALGFVGAKLLLGVAYIYDETLYLDACYQTLPWALNQGYATIISLGLAF